MPDYPPPGECPGTPVVASVAAGARLWRVHSDTCEPTEFNPTDPEAPAAGGGGRFDSPAGRPPYLYAASSIEAALSETILRDLPFPPRGARELMRRQILGRRISELVATRDIMLTALHGAGLAQLGQDLWLVHCDSADYSKTREWGSWIRSCAQGSAGFEWRPRHFDDAWSYVFYGDSAADALEGGRSDALDSPEGAALIVPALHALNVAYPVA